MKSPRRTVLFLAVFLCATGSTQAEKKPESQGTQQASLEQLTTQYTLLFTDEKYPEALAVAQQAVNAAEKQYGAEHPAVAQALNDSGLLYGRVGKPEEAVLAHQRALAIRRKAFEADSAEVAQSLGNLARAHQAQRQFADAEALYAELLTVLRKRYAPDNPGLLGVMSRYADCLRDAGKNDQADALEAEIRAGKMENQAPAKEAEK